MRILHITKKYPRALGGDAVAVSNLEKQQRKHRDQVSVLTSNCDEIQTDARHHKFGLRDTPANLDRITPRRLLSLAALVVASFRVIRKEKPDVVHTHSVDMAFAASFAARRYKVPLVHTFHILTFPDPHHSALRRKTELWFLKGARPQAVTAPNPTDLAHLQKAGVPNATLLPYGIDLDFWQKKRTVKHATFTFITAARLEAQKGNEFLIRAVALLRQKTKTPFKVIIVGDGSLQEALQALAAEKRVSDSIEFVGRKTPEEVRALYARSDAAVIPSLWESGPLTAFEAWAMKLPLIITPVGMFAAEPKDGRRVLLARAADHKSLAKAMEQMLTDNKLRRTLARNGHAAVQQHGWGATQQTAKAIYEQARQPAGAVAAAGKTGKTFQISQRLAVIGLTVASLAALCLAPALSPTINTLTTLPLVTFVPGLLALLAAWPAVAKKPAAAVGISTALGLLLIALEGAGLNWLLPIAGISDPLRAVYLVPTHLLTTMLLFGWWNKQQAGKQTPGLTVQISSRSIARAVLPLALPLLFAAGAFRQNNGAGNTLTLAAFSATAVMAAWFVWKPKLWNASWLLYNIALGLLLSTSLRSWFVSGFDISQEFQVFGTTLHNHYWDIHALPGNAYNACLSLTTLPTALQQFTGVGAEVIFKFFYQAVFALTAVFTYVIGRRFIDKRLAFLAALLYAAQTQFIGTMPAIARQEIGLLFFGGLVYLLLDGAMLTRARKVLLTVLSLGLVLTHYSTTYLTIMIFAATAAVLFVAKWLPGRLPRLPKLETRLAAATFAKLAVLLLLLSTIWYSQLNASSGNVVGTLRAAAHSHLPHSLHPDTTSEKARLLLGGEQDQTDPQAVANYTAAQKLHAPIQAASVPKLPVKNGFAVRLADIGRDILAIVLKVVLPLSPLLLLAWKKTRTQAADISLVSLGAVVVFAAVILVPALSVSYNLQRVYQQCLMLLGATGLWALWMLLPVGRRLKTIAVSAFVLLFFVLSPGSGLVNQLAGGSAPRLTYNSSGEEYDKYFVRESDTLGAAWLARNCQGQAAWADRYATLRLTAYGAVPYDSIRSDILGAKNGCLYLDYANTHDGLYYATYKKLPVRYTTPESSFAGYDLIYSNGESKVYQYR